MELSLSDSETYMTLTHNLVNKLLTQLKTLLKDWKRRGFVENSVYNNLNSSNPVVPLAYGLPKISRHPLCQKVGTIVGLIARVLSLSHPIYHQANFELIIKILINNGYPLKLIFSEIKNRLSRNFKRWNDHNNTIKDGSTVNNVDKINNSFFTIPFIPFLSEKIKKFFNKGSVVRMAYRGINNLRGFIKGHKDLCPKLSHTDVVYKINCRDCEASYVGQTSRCLKTRINEHRNHINWNTTQHSVITEHRISHHHEFDWENIKILDNERALNKILISEMIHIKQQKQSLNL
ncbi:hypothetical protein ALC57_08319 [Trachymyrmex cornetzi]|uniref:Helix-turn-helix domain-containing protein n=1 Tax=Trachymyrmex cornetzi TaxID=471704 RepID=A0A151J726_9HYME|nr:hypothetical protein ALC57_08319 [Trachymyrmex cornetzi]